MVVCLSLLTFDIQGDQDRSAASCPMGKAPATHWILPFIIKQEHRNIDGREENMN